MSRSSITKEFECAGCENKVLIHIGSNDSYLMFGLSPLQTGTFVLGDFDNFYY